MLVRALISGRFQDCQICKSHVLSTSTSCVGSRRCRCTLCQQGSITFDEGWCRDVWTPLLVEGFVQLALGRVMQSCRILSG